MPWAARSKMRQVDFSLFFLKKQGVCLRVAGLLSVFIKIEEDSPRTDHMVPDEKILLHRLGEGDRDAFAALYNTYAPKCLEFVNLLLKDDAASEDITHDIFIKVWQKREKVSRVESFHGYVFMMTRNAVLNHLQHRKTVRTFLQHVATTSVRATRQVDEQVSVDEMYMLILRTVASMPQRRREIFSLSRFKGMSNPEIARHFGISIRTVETQISLALADLRTSLAQI